MTPDQKTLGLIGGMSWESTSLYYRIINTEIRVALGGLHSAKLIVYSFDFEEIVALQKSGDWEKAGDRLAQAGKALKAAGADALVICTNTMHITAGDVENGTGLPVIHIADCTAAEILRHGIDTVGLIGTQFTMEQPFYRERLESHSGIKVVIPAAEDRAAVHRIIFDELCKGIVRPESRALYHGVIRRLKAQGAKAVILGCTELCMLIEDQSVEGLPVFDTTLLHARYAARFALSQDMAATLIETV